MSNRQSDSDVLIEFDHHSAEYRDRYPQIYQELRSKCPVGFTEAHGGYWVASSYDAVSDAARDSNTFTAWKDTPGDNAPKHGLSGVAPLLGALVPDPHPETRQGFSEMDGPMHLGLRQQLTPFFTPAKVAELRTQVENDTAWAIDQFIESGKCDLVNDLAGPVPALLAMRTLGLPIADWRAYADSAHKAFYTVPGSAEFDALSVTRAWLHEQLERTIIERRKDPQDDMASLIANMKFKDKLLDLEDAVGTLQLVLFGGVDTTTNLLASAFMHLAGDTAARAWLMEDTSRIATAGEEYLRFYAPVQGLARTVLRPCVLEGQQLDVNDRVWLSWAAANRDPEAFEAPEDLRLDRVPNRHTSFGLGAHRCLGSAVARLLFDVVLKAVLFRLSDYRVAESAQRYPSIGIMNGWTEIPATFTPGVRQGATVKGLI